MAVPKGKVSKARRDNGAAPTGSWRPPVSSPVRSAVRCTCLTELCQECGTYNGREVKL